MKPHYLILIPIVISLCLPTLRAVSPPPDGGYPGLNTAEGQNALLSLDTSTGFANTAVGSLSLQSSVDSSFNTSVGAGTLSLNTGNENTAVGAAALLLNTTGDANTALGVDALLNNISGGRNTAIGYGTLLGNTTGSENTATGFGALFSNTEGSLNTANGDNALFSNTTGTNNTANGHNALFRNINGELNTATGADALFANVGGSFNTADGKFALINNTDGDSNTAVGHAALFNITTGSLNTALGENAGNNLSTGDSNNIDIGANVEGVAGESNTIRIGNPDITATIIRGISGATIPSGAAVLVAANGQLGTVTSSGRFKEDVKPMDKSSEALFSLKPVTFRYKKKIDPAGTSQFGLVAEDVEKVNPNLVVRDESGNVSTVRYDQVNAMLLNEFLKEHGKVQELAATLVQQQNDFQAKLEKQEKQMVALASDLQRVSAELEICKPAPQLVCSDR